MTDHPLVNDSFALRTTTEPTTDLLAEQRRLNLIVEDMQKAIRNAHQYEAEGRFYAGVAAVWAGALLSADVARAGMMLFVPHASPVFAAWDKTVIKAERILKLLGCPKSVTREDILKDVDPRYRDVQAFIVDVQSSRNLLKTIGIAAPKRVDQMLDGAVFVSHDALLVLTAFKQREDIARRAALSLVQMSADVGRVRRRVMILGLEVNRIIEQRVWSSYLDTA